MSICDQTLDGVEIDIYQRPEQPRQPAFLLRME
jgi:hypothetical protein